MSLITSELVLGVVRPLWPMLAGDGAGVDVELAPRAASAPVRAMLGWSAEHQRWHVLADSALTPKQLNWILHHEAAHVRHGDATRAHRISDLDRAMFAGDGTAGAAIRRHGWIASYQTPIAHVEEKAADAWADEKARQTWRILEAAEKAAITAIMKMKGRYNVRG